MVSTPTMTRRTALLTTAGAVAGGTAFTLAGSDRARASVEADSLSIPTQAHESTQSTVDDVVLAVAGEYHFSVPKADEYSIELYVASDTAANDYQRVGRTGGPAMSTSMGASFGVEGSVLAHDDLGAAAFAAAPEQTTTVLLPVRVELTVTAGGEAVATAAAETTATVEVTNTSIKATATIGGSGGVTVVA